MLSDLRAAPEDLPHIDEAAVEATVLAVLDDSVRARVSGIRTAQTPRIAVLFSGGLDCTVVAALAHRHVPHDEPIDLITVAFENPRAIAAARARGETADPYNVPDRQSARASFADLSKLPREWRLVQVDVPHAEYTAHLEHIQALIYPSESVMDLSIGAALYFAGRARGTVNGAVYESPAPVALSGLGADELLGGYSRHRQACRRGADSLAHELQLDLDRLPARNLGRDDRVISAHAREMRYPYLAWSVLEMLTSLPISAKMDLRTNGGDKRLLRRIAESLGLTHASSLPKRAIQFGARSAKMDADAARRKGGELLWS